MCAPLPNPFPEHHFQPALRRACHSIRSAFLSGTRVKLYRHDSPQPPPPPFDFYRPDGPRRLSLAQPSRPPSRAVTVTSRHTQANGGSGRGDVPKVTRIESGGTTPPNKNPRRLGRGAEPDSSHQHGRGSEKRGPAGKRASQDPRGYPLLLR